MVDLESFLNSIKSASNPATARGSKAADTGIKDADKDFAAIFTSTVAAIKPAQSGKPLPPTANLSTHHSPQGIDSQLLESRQLQSGLTVLVAGPQPSDRAIAEFAADQGIDLSALKAAQHIDSPIAPEVLQDQRRDPQPSEFAGRQVPAATDHPQPRPVDNSGADTTLAKQPAVAATADTALEPLPVSPPLTAERIPPIKQQLQSASMANPQPQRPPSPSVTETVSNSQSAAPQGQSAPDNNRDKTGQQLASASAVLDNSDRPLPNAPHSTQAVLQTRNWVAADQKPDATSVPAHPQFSSTAEKPAVDAPAMQSPPAQSPSSQSPIVQYTIVQSPIVQPPLAQSPLTTANSEADGLPYRPQTATAGRVEGFVQQPTDQPRSHQPLEVAVNPKPKVTGMAQIAGTAEPDGITRSASVAVQPTTAISAMPTVGHRGSADKLAPTFGRQSELPPASQSSVRQSPPSAETDILLNSPKTQDGLPLRQNHRLTDSPANPTQTGAHGRVAVAETANPVTSTGVSPKIGHSDALLKQPQNSAALSQPSVKTAASLNSPFTAAFTSPRASSPQAAQGVAPDQLPKGQPAATLTLGELRGGLTKSSRGIVPSTGPSVVVESINLVPNQASAGPLSASLSVTGSASGSEIANLSIQPGVVDGGERNPVPVLRETAAADSALRQDQSSQMSKILSEALGQRIIAQLARGEWRVEMQLHPASLGRIEVHLEMKNGELEANFYTANQTTKELINEGLPRLRHALEQQGMETAHRGLEQGNQGKSNGSSTGQNNSREPYAEAQSAETAPDRPTDTVTDDGLDILI